YPDSMGPRCSIERGGTVAPTLHQTGVVDPTASCRQQTPFRVLFFVLLLITSAERLLSELDFERSGVERIENNEKPDGDEIANRLVFVEHPDPPRAPAIREDDRTVVELLYPHPRALVAVRLSELRVPPSFPHLGVKPF